MVYRVAYKEYMSADVKYVDVPAKNKADAYDKAVYEMIEKSPYSAWVESVTYQNGNYRRFNNFEGSAY